MDPSNDVSTATGPDQIEEAQQLIASDHFEEAGELLESISFEDVTGNDEVIGRFLALFVADLQERYVDALHHGDALLDAGARDPAIFHLTGKALWENGAERGGAEALIKAAEILIEHEDLDWENLMVDPKGIFYLAGQAAAWFEQYESARTFYEEAHHLDPGNEAIEEAIEEVEKRY